MSPLIAGGHAMFILPIFKWLIPYFEMMTGLIYAHGAFAFILSNIFRTVSRTNTHCHIFWHDFDQQN